MSDPCLAWDLFRTLDHITVALFSAKQVPNPHAIILTMLDDSQDKEITVRVIRDGLPEPPDNDWLMASPEERVEAVWMLTKLCLAWNNPSESEPEFQRTVTRIQRARR